MRKNHVSFHIERTHKGRSEAATVPPEYLPLLKPWATVYFRNNSRCLILDQQKKLKYFTIWHQYVEAKKDLTLAIKTPHALRSLHQLRNPGYDALNFYHVVNKHQTIEMPAHSKLSSFHINITPIHLRKLTKVYPWLTVLADKRSANETRQLNVKPYQNNPVVSLLFSTIEHCRWIGAAATHFLYRLVLDVLHNICIQDIYPQEVPAIIPHQVFDEIAGNAFCVASAAEIARLYRMPLHELDHAFLSQFGTHLSHFLHMMQMMELYTLICTTSLPLNSTATAAGYESWLELSQAFKIYYGISPQALRNAR
jgi:AraC-like DNA-binding protein